MATYQQQQGGYSTSRLLNTTTTGMTQGSNLNAHMQYTVTQPLMDYNWYLMTDLDNFVGKPVESILKLCTSVKPVACLNDEQLNVLQYPDVPLNFNNEKWFV